MRLRRLAVAAALVTVVVLPASSAVAEPSAHPSASAAAGAAASASAFQRPAKPAASAKFAVAGTVASVDATAGTIKINVKSGTKDVRRKTVTIVIAGSARIRVNGAKGTLADVKTGFRVAVSGTRSGTTYTATRVEARLIKAHPSPSTSPSPSDDDATPEPGHSESPEPSASPTT